MESKPNKTVEVLPGEKGCMSVMVSKFTSFMGKMYSDVQLKLFVLEN